MRRGGKLAHVVADFGHNDAGTQFAESRNVGQRRDGDAKGLDAFVQSPIDLSGADGIYC